MDQPPHLRITLDQAGAGMVLADELSDGHGTVLLPQGAILTEATLASLRRRGVAQCVVVRPAQPGHGDADADGGAPAARAALRQHQLARLQHLFRHSAGQEANATLLQLLTDYRNQE
ncbi:hypothetical protein H3H36_13510 [Duganella sp. FT3S]|uniref:Uncharacterized protein n=2 Tax=Rugamonas fusca TaxID=2758568 RepID=A0A7W2EI62_9BURK|nr:hypothetical protein [Rugamonas fusca]